MSKPARQTKKESLAECSMANASGAISRTVTDVLHLLEQHRVALTAHLKSSFANLDTKLDKIQAIVSEQGQRITDLESNSEVVSQHLENLEATCSSLREDNRWLKSKLSDSEGRSRRQNIRISLPESVEGTQPIDFFSQLL